MPKRPVLTLFIRRVSIVSIVFEILICKNPPANLLRHGIESNTISTADMSFATIIRPRAQDQQAPCSTSIKECVRGLVVVAESIICQTNKWPPLTEQDLHHLPLLGRDERRHHHHTLPSHQHTAVHVVAQRLIIPCLRSPRHRPAHMHYIKAPTGQQSHVAHTAIRPRTYHDVLLHAEEARFQAFCSQTLRIHIQVADGVLQLAVSCHRADEGHLLKNRLQSIIGIIAQQPAQPRRHLLQPPTPLLQPPPILPPFISPSTLSPFVPSSILSPFSE